MDLDSGQARVVNMIKTIKYLHDWRSWDRQVPSQYRTSKNYMVSRKVYFLLLPTGIAANNINGTTIHSFTGKTFFFKKTLVIINNLHKSQLT